MSEQLKGIRVVELGTHVAVPKVARMMADFGADVVKVEPPRGEAWRTMGPAYNMPATPDDNPIFQVENMNKKSIALDLKSERDREIMLDLLKNADVFVTNTRDKALEKLGFDYGTIREACPKLIYLHFGAYGPKGPEKDSPGFDLASFWAKSGTMIEWTLASQEPFAPKPGVADTASGSLALNGVLAALFDRERTGKGSYVECSLLSSALWCNSIGLLRGQPRYGLHFPMEIATDPLVPPYQTKDGHWVFAASPSWADLYPKVFKLIGLGDRIGDPMLHERDAAREHYAEVCGMIADAWVKFTADEILKLFTDNDIVCAKILGPNDMYSDEQAWANDYLAHITLDNGEDLVVPRIPVRFGGEELPTLEKASQLNADAEEVLKGIGYSDERIKEFLG